MTCTGPILLYEQVKHLRLCAATLLLRLREVGTVKATVGAMGHGSKLGSHMIYWAYIGFTHIIYIYTHYNDRYINQQIYVCIIMHTFCKFKLHNYGQSTLRTQWAMASSSRTQSYPPITRSTYIMSGNCNYDIYIYIIHII